MNDEVFIKHYNMRHRRSDTPAFVIDIPYSRMQDYGYFRAFHIRCHQAEVDGDLVNGLPAEYDHLHQDEEEQCL